MPHRTEENTVVMDIKQEKNAFLSPNNAFIDNFASWVGSRGQFEPPPNLIIERKRPRHSTKKLTEKKPPLKTKKLRVLVKRLEMVPAKRVNKTPVINTSLVRTVSRPSDKTGNYRSVMAKRPLKMQPTPKTYRPPQTKLNITTLNKLIKCPPSSLKPLNVKLDKDYTTLTLAPQSNEAKSKTKLITPTVFKNNTFAKLTSDEEDFMDVLNENLMLDEAVRNKYNIKKMQNDRIKNSHGNATAVVQKAAKGLKENKEFPKLAKKPNIPRPSKAVQTKFTCNDNICGIIDTQAFNINCFYCYDIFPIKKWPTFINHMKRTHQLDERAQKMADMLLMTPRNVKTKEKKAYVKLAGEKRPCGHNETEKPTVSPPPSKMMKRIIPDLNPKDVENFFNILDLESDDLESITNSTNTPATAKKLVKLAPSRETAGEDKNQSQSLPVVQIKNGKLPSAAVSKKLCDLSKILPIKSSANPKSYLLSGNSKTSTNHIDLSDIKQKFVKLPSSMKIVKKAAMQTSNAQVATAAISPNHTSIKGTPRVYVVKKVFESNKSKNEDFEDTTEIIIKAEETKQSATKGIEPVSVKVKPPPSTCIEPASVKVKPSSSSREPASVNKTIQLSIKTEFEELPKKVSHSKSKRCPLPSPVRYWDSDDEMQVSGEDDDWLPISRDICVDSEETTKSAVNLKITTTTKILEETSTKKAPQPIITTTIEAIPPKVSSPRSKLPTAPPPFPSFYLDSEDEMPSNDENEDDVPSSTNGCGILFGLTNNKIVLEFLKQLQNYPDLYNFERNKKITIDYRQFHDSIQKLRTHLNETFNIDMTEFEIRLSIQRIKYWYCRTLQKIEHSKNAGKSSFKHTFPEYFKIMDKFLTYDVSYTKDLVLGRRFQGNDINELNRYPTWMVCKQGTGPLKPNRNNKHEVTTLDLMNVLTDDMQFDEDDMFTDSEDERPTGSPHTHAPPEPFICDICFVDFNRRIDLRRHRVGHFAPKHPCSACRRMHYSRKSAEKCPHMDTSTKKPKSNTDRQVSVTNKPQNGEKWMCEICGSCYKSVGSLNYHKKDKHFNLRHKCKICKFTSITNYRLVQHQIKRHVVEYGTCEEIAKRTRPRRDSTRVPFTPEARKEFEWLREMRKHKKPQERFFGCFKCKLVFTSRKEKMLHNKSHHPIKETTVVCLLCKSEKALFVNSNSIRRHYTVVHKVPWDEIDDLVSHTKPLWKLLTPEEIDLLHSCDNHSLVVAQMLAKRELGSAAAQNLEDIYDDMEYNIESGCLTTENVNSVQNGNSKLMYQRHRSTAGGSYDDDESIDDVVESTLYNDFELDHDYNEIHESSEYENSDDGQSGEDAEEQPQLNEFQDANGRRLYIVEENYGNDYFEVDVGEEQGAAAVDIDNGYLEEHIIEEIVEDDFIDHVMEAAY